MLTSDKLRVASDWIVVLWMAQSSPPNFYTGIRPTIVVDMLTIVYEFASVSDQKLCFSTVVALR